MFWVTSRPGRGPWQPPWGFRFFFWTVWERFLKILIIHLNLRYFLVHSEIFLGGLHACPLFYGSIKISTFVAPATVFGQIGIFSKYVFCQWSVHNFKTFHHRDRNLVSKWPLGTWLCILNSYPACKLTNQAIFHCNIFKQR